MTRGFTDDSDDKVVVEDAHALSETALALLVQFDERETWIPKSCIHDDSEVYARNDTGKLIVKGWFARGPGAEAFGPYVE